MTLKKHLHEKNRASWNAATPAHNRHKVDQAAFLRGGGSTLFPEELALLGDVRGRTVAHLLCNCGQDSLSLAALGAKVTGVDISDEAIAFARDLSRDSGLVADFERSDVYDWLESSRAAGRTFDLVYASYGALCWLSDLAGFLRGVAAIIEPGGRLVTVEFHPVAAMYDEALERRYPYRGDETVVETSGVGDYVADGGDALSPSGFRRGGDDFDNPYADYTFPFGLGDLVTGCAGSGLLVERLEEYDHANGARLFHALREASGRTWRFAENAPSFPLMFGLVARRTGA